MITTLEDNHAYCRAKSAGLAIEEQLRARAFLPIPETICGIEVVPLTLRILLRLTAAHNPFSPLLAARRPRSSDVMTFLWAVSPGYSLRTKKARERAKQELSERAVGISYRRAVRGVRRYMFYAFMDRPPSPRKKVSGAAAASFAAFFCHHIASAYGWDDEAVLDKPLRRLFQYLNVIRIESSPKAVAFNPIVDRLTKPIRKKLLA